MQRRAKGPVEQPTIIDPAMILAPRGLVRILVQILVRDVVVLALNHPAQPREVGLRLIGASVTVAVGFAVVDAARIKDGMENVPVPRGGPH